MSRLAVSVALTVLAGCSEYNVSPGVDPSGGPSPDILVTPSALQYGELSTGQEEVQTFLVENIGEAELDVSDIRVVEGLGAFTVLSETAFGLAPGESTAIDVAFTPMGVENYGQVRVVSDDPDSAEVPVDLLGFGAVPELAITPDDYIFPGTAIPCGDAVDLELSNVGSETLVISDAVYTSGGLLTLDASEVSLPLTLQPGESAWVTVNFAATEAGQDAGELAVTSNDPRGVVKADQNAEGTFADITTESFTEPGVPPVDVMFLIDQSCSMEEDNMDDIENGIPGFISTLSTVSDWQLIQVTKETGCANGGIMDATTVSPETLLINNAFNATHHAYTEALLQLASIALNQTGPGQCNEGFLRPGALLHIIVASDEEEQSGLNWAGWLAGYQSFTAAPELVKVSAIADINVNCGDFTGADGYEDIALATGGSLLNICSSNWGSSMTDIASDVLEGMETYTLAEQAVEGSLEVTVNGVATTDFTYSAATNAVTVNDPPVGEGDVVDVTYGVAAVCN